MASSAFDEKSSPPDAERLAAVLGESSPYWDAIVRSVEERCAGVAKEWKFYGSKLGWQLKLTHKKRAVVYLVPREGRFLAAMALRPDAMEELRDHDLPPALVREIEEAKTLPEGKAARVEVGTERDAEVVRRLLAIKLAR